MKQEVEYPYPFYSDRRHLQKKETEDDSEIEWRIKDKLKTVSVSLVLCLNIGVDPPDIVKTKPCAKMECWIDPFAATGQKALEAIGRSLQAQYEAWQPRARYRLSLDPSIEETKKQCCSLRRHAKEERILFHYNGHGVPKPTVGGEIWVFNKSYTQYIPVSIYDIQSWLGAPCIYVYDCSCAGFILNAFNKFAAQRDLDGDVNTTNPSSRLTNCIQLAACGPNQILPMLPDLPADLFTACLTTPITIALRFYVLTNPLIKNLNLDMAMKVPGKVTDRRTPLGELNWIFTSITDTIAWNILPTDLFLRLFRNDLMVAALFRNFLLADRIMRYYNCTPMSNPILPETHHHPMWEVWDLAVDQCLSQLPKILEGNSIPDYRPCTFFADQLSAFEVWIKRAGSVKELPLQLPVVLQVLLSQVHRLRALMLLSKFLDFGKWAVELALSVGIFPYVSRLLQSPALELRSVLVFIWTKILAVDPSCRSDLLKDQGFTYFLGLLSSAPTGALHIANISEHRAMCVFILSVFCHDYPPGQQACLSNDLLSSLLCCVGDQDSLLRQWACICLGNFWSNFPQAKWAAFNSNAYSQTAICLMDQVPEVRAAAVYALGALYGQTERLEQVLMIERYITVSLLKVSNDASPLVRKELVCALSLYVLEEELIILPIALRILEEERSGKPNVTLNADIEQSIAITVWKLLLSFSVDPYPEVSEAAISVVDKVYTQICNLGMVDDDMVQILEDKKINFSFFKSRNLEKENDFRKNFNSQSRGSVASGIFGFSDSPGAFKRNSSFANFSLRSLGSFVTGNSSGNIVDPLARHHKKNTNAPRRPTSLYLASSSPGDTGQPNASSSDIQGLEDKAGPKNGFVKSSFFHWCCEYFMEPQMKVPEADDPGSVLYCSRQWRKTRNSYLNAESIASYNNSHISPFNTHLKTISHNLSFQTTRKATAFHPYDPHIVCADAGQISVIDWEKEIFLNSITNYNPKNSQICSLKFINEEDSSILLVGSNDGVVRLYSDYAEQEKARLVSAWNTSAEMLPSKPQTIVCEWNQLSGTLFVSGADSKLKCWDADEELLIQEIDMEISQNITTIHVDTTGNLILCGFSDSSVRMIDRRLPPVSCVVACYQYGTGSCLGAKFSTTASSEMISASSDGDILLWDIKMQAPALKIETVDGKLLNFDIHNEAPLIATFNEYKKLNIMNFQGKMLGNITGMQGLLTRQPLTCQELVFHPKRLLLSCTAPLNLIFYESESHPKYKYY